MGLLNLIHHRTESGTSKAALETWDLKARLYKDSLNKEGDIGKENRE